VKQSAKGIKMMWFEISVVVLLAFLVAATFSVSKSIDHLRASVSVVFISKGDKDDADWWKEGSEGQE